MTGNVCVWPSEEAMAAFLLENPSICKGKDVVEVGAGMTGLAGFAAIQACQPKSAVLTDGNVESVCNLKTIIKRNKMEEKASAELLRWEWQAEHEQMKVLVGKFDVAVCSDCLFFDDGRGDLVRCLDSLLRDGGRAIVVAPSRGGTREDFVRLCADSGSFKVARQTTDFSSRITARVESLKKDSRYEEDRHSPSLIELVKI